MLSKKRTAMKKIAKLERLRNSIDSLDEKIVGLLVKRAEVSVEIGKLKQEDRSPVKDAGREDQVLKKVRSRSRKPMTKSAVEKIYVSVLRESRGLQSKSAKKKSS